VIIVQLKGIYDSLSESERRVAKYIIERPDDVIHYTITELAKFSHSSEATVYRLVKKLGFSGYQSFKISLARELSIPQEVIEEGSEGSYQNFVERIVQENISLAKETMAVLDLDALKKAVELIINARRLVFFGVGRSAVVAQSGSFNFALLGFSSTHYIDPHAQVMVASGLTNEDVVVGISHTGTIRDTVKSVQVAHAAGAKTIVITSGINSPITEVGDVVLYTAAGKPSTSEFTVSRIGEFLILDILYKTVVARMSERLSKHFDKLEEILKPKRF